MPFALLLVVVLAHPAIGYAQAAGEQPPERPDAPQTPLAFEAQVDVIAVTPIHGVGLSRLKIPSNVQVFTADDASAATPDPASLLAARAASVHVVDAQGGTFQPDLLFRGFSGSPLLGASEGLAVYQNGVRVNEAFGDTVNWDALPAGAVASINLMPGSNPLFGLNALGGAVSIRTKDGFTFRGGRASATTGSFGRHQVQAEAGGHGRSLAYFVAGSLARDAGWRDFSPSTMRRLFGDVAWRGTASTMDFSVTTASNDMHGNGAVPIQLLERDRAAVLTHPDRTDNDLLLLTARAQRRGPAGTFFDAVTYYRHSRIGTFNGDAADDDLADGERFDAVNMISRTRGRAAGVTTQVTRTAPLLGRQNHFIAGAGFDRASSRFDFAAELARLTPERGTVGSGSFDADAFVDLYARSVTGSAFATDTWSVGARVDLTASARFNWTSIALRDRIGTALNGDHRFGRINPAAGLTYEHHAALNLYGSYTESSRVPTPVELTCADPEDPCRLPNAFVSDPPLEQIVARTWEAGTRGTRGRTSWAVAAFNTSAADDIIFVSSGTLRGEGHFENVARTHRAGLEASVEYAAGDRVSAFGAYTLQRATFGTALRIASRFHPLADGTEIPVSRGDRLPGVPAHVGKLGLDAAPNAGLTLSVHLRAQSSQFMRGDEANLLSGVPGFAVVDAQARQRIGRRAWIVASFRNLFDARYATFGVLGDASLLGAAFEDEPRFHSPGEPRAAWIGLDVRF